MFHAVLGLSRSTSIGPARSIFPGSEVPFPGTILATPEPELDNLGILFSTASEIILIALAGIAELLPISIEQFLEVEYQALNKLPTTPD